MRRRAIEALIQLPKFRPATACRIFIHGTGSRRAALNYLRALSLKDYPVSIVAAGRERALEVTIGIVITFYEGSDHYLVRFFSSRADMIVATDGAELIVESASDRALKVLRPHLSGLQ